MDYKKDNQDVVATITALFEISNAVNNTDNLDDLYASIHRSLNKILKIENFAIAIYHKEKDSMTFPYFVDELNTAIEEVFNISKKQSLSAQVINAGKPLIFYEEDILKMPNRSGRIAFHSACKVWAGAPLKVKDRSFGALLVQSYRSKDAFKKSDLDLLNSVAQFIAVSIDRKQIQIAHKESEEVNLILNEIISAVHSSENLSQLFETIHHILGRIIDVLNFFIAIVDMKEHTLHFPYFVDTIDDDFVPITNFETHNSLTGLVVTKRKPILLKAKELKKRQEQNGVWGPVPLSWMGVPLIIKDEVIGVVAVQSYIDSNLYNQQDLQILSTVSDQIAIAIDRKRAEDALRESEKKLSQIYNNILDVYFEVRLDGTILEISPSIEKYSQYKPEELIGKSFDSIFINPENGDNLSNFIINKGSVNNHEIFLTFKDGMQHICSINAEILKDDQNNPVKLIGTMRDISDKKTNEYERERFISLLKATLESTADGILVADQEGIWTNFNQKFIDIWSIPSHILENRNDKEIKKYVIATIVDPEIFLASVRVLSNDSIDHSFDMIELKNGKILECYSQPQNIGEEIVGRVWSFRDITQRKLIENALRVSDKKLMDLSNQTEQLSLAAASMVTIKDEQKFFKKISKAIVAFSDFKRVLISLFKSESPFRNIIAFDGVEAEVVDKLRKVEMPKEWYGNVFKEENIIGNYSYYIPHTKKEILNQEATIYGKGSVPEFKDKWHPEDNLFVKMNDDKGDIIGVISVDESKSGLKPSPETVRPLEIFSSLISQIVILKKEQKERRKAELWASEQRLASMIEQSPLAVIEWNLNFEVIKWNLAAEQMFGFTEKEAIGHHVAGLIVHEKVRPKLDQVWQSLIDQTGGTHFVNDNFTKDGRTITCEWHNKSLINTKGKISGVFSVIQDITKRKLAEHELKKAKETAEEATLAKSVFLANMSHELRTPLNSILGYTQILKRDRNLQKKQKDAIDTIHVSGEHLLTLISELLDISRIEAQKIELELANVPLPGFLKDITDIAQIRAQQEGVTFKYEITSKLPAGVRADEKRLRQILLNLINNAIKFAKTGSVIFRVSAKLLTAKDSKFPIASILCEVEDTGIGISSDEIENIFLPFHQVKKTTLATEGTGLGLPISRNLVRIMGSELQVKSVVGQGTIFWFELELPVIESMAVHETSSRMEHARQIIGFKGDRKKLLIVDDDKKNRAVLIDMLLPLGFEITEAMDGEDALAKTTAFNPDLIFMDLMMPVMDGIEATQRIRQSSVHKDIIVISVSASVYDSTKQTSFDAGCNDFIVKPVKIDRLLECLQEHLKVEWLYDEVLETDSGKLQAKESLPLAVPTNADLKTLLRYAEISHITGIQQALESIKKLDDQFIPFVTTVEDLLENLQFKQIIKIIQSYLQGEE